MAESELKERFRKECEKSPEKHYPVQALKQNGFERRKCTSCGRHFWASTERENCGEPACSGGFGFIKNSPAKKALAYTEVWKEFSKIHKKLGYAPIKRYPVVSRWNPTTEFTIASIAAFQPYVVSGEVEPPANPLVIPQFCLRFPDIDNVGITGHNVGFVMLGEHAFVKPQEYDPNKYFSDHLEWLTKGMKIPKEELAIHEDAWAGGGNLGPCVEFFSRGLELSNQVYMQYEETPSGIKELKIKVLDMGQGQERAAWFSQGTPTNYDATFPEVLKLMKARTGIELDNNLMAKFSQYAPYLNVLESKDISKNWQFAALKLGMTVQELKEKIIPVAALYSVAEHSRALLVALNDGALPSNVGGMYNLRVLLRRALGFIDKYGWKLSLPEICEWHAKELKAQFPELSENLAGIRKILDVEKQKYDATKQKTAQLLHRVFEKEITQKDLIELYDSHGISPEMLAEEGAKLGKKIPVPENFYALVSALHEHKEQETATERAEKIELGELPDTEGLYFDDWKKTEFRAKVLKIKDCYVVLDKTCFYPVSGGQLNDTGTIDGTSVVEVFKQGGIIVHKLAEKPKFTQGSTVVGKIDFERREQLAQHHTATHIVNAASRKVLGRHINQASAKKDIDKAYLDVTHYQLITDEELAKIEHEANKIVKQAIPVLKKFYPRNEAEKKFGMAIYQGGAVPGKEIRIVEIPGVDVEACGGTHLNNTSEAETIKILKATKVKDGVVRILFAAGKAAMQIIEKEKKMIAEIAKILGVEPKQIPARAEELFTKWKKARKATNKGQKLPAEEFVLKAKQEFEGDILAKTAEILETQPEHIAKSLQRFLKELEEFKKRQEQA